MKQSFGGFPETSGDTDGSLMGNAGQMYWIFMEKRMAAPRFCFTVTHKLPATGNACAANAPFGFGLRLSACFPTVGWPGSQHGARGGADKTRNWENKSWSCANKSQSCASKARSCEGEGVGMVAADCHGMGCPPKVSSAPPYGLISSLKHSIYIRISAF